MDDIKGIAARVGDETIGEMWSLYDGSDVLPEIDPRFAENIERHIFRALKDIRFTYREHRPERRPFQSAAGSRPRHVVACCQRNRRWY
ncbi:MAG: hypothetical protein ACNYPI_06825 [Arenicellales bacterium WSBS_2016_MAG_OTU3]